MFDGIEELKVGKSCLRKTNLAEIRQTNGVSDRKKRERRDKKKRSYNEKRGNDDLDWMVGNKRCCLAQRYHGGKNERVASRKKIRIEIEKEKDVKKGKKLRVSKN